MTLGAGRGPGLAEAPSSERAAWPWPTFALRWLASAGAARRCGARRCGLLADGHRRFCGLHDDAVVARFGAGRDAREAAAGRLSRHGNGTRRRLEAWVDSMVEVGYVNLIADGYEGAAYDADGGIVTEP